MNKSIKKIIVTSASLLMMASVGAGVGTLSRSVHAASQAEVAKLFAAKDPNKAIRNYINKHSGPTVRDVKLSPAEQKQQKQEDAASDKQAEKAEIMQEEDGAHVNAPHAKILNAGSMALSEANGKLADKLNNALQHKNYKLIKRLTAKINAQSQPSKKSTRRHKTHKHTKKSKRTAKKRRRRTRAKHHKARKHHAESNAEIAESLRKQGVPKSERMKVDLLTPEQKRDNARTTAWANKVDRDNDIKDYESEGMTRSQAIAHENAYEKQKQARIRGTFTKANHHTTKKHRRHAKRNHRAKKYSRCTHARKHVTKKRDRK